MEDRQNIEIEADGFMMFPRGLARDQTVSAEAKALYAIMGSFGPESRASIASQCSRLGKSDKWVRKYQKELRETGWLFLKKEAKNNNPREWFLPMTKNSRPKPKEGDLLEGLNSGASPEVPSKLDKNKHIDKDINITQRPKNKEYVEAFFNKYKDKHGIEPKPPAYAYINLAKFLKKDPPNLEEWCRRLDNYFTDPWMNSHTLPGFMQSWDKWVVKREEGFNQPEEKNNQYCNHVLDTTKAFIRITPRLVKGVCRSCGIKVTTEHIE